MGRKINYINPRCKMTESIGPKKTQIAIRDIKKNIFKKFVLMMKF